MAIFRKIHTSFWSDSFVSDLEKEKKLFYLYLLTNERTRQCGVYEITKRQIAYDLGYTIDTVSKQLEFFISKGKIRFNEATNELAIGNWLKYNGSTSPKVQSCINKEFKLVKDTVLIEYVKSMDTHPQEEQEEEQEETVLPDRKKYLKFIEWFNGVMGKTYRGDKNSEGQFSARLKENYTSDNFKTALLAMREDSFHKENNYKYITPEFLTRQAQLEKWSNFKVEVTPNYSNHDGLL